MSHSKRNTSLAFFTSYERSLLKGDYGKQRTRLTRDSFKVFDACNLCLMRARDPVSCPNGDLFCNECVVENLLAQHKEIERMQSELDRRLQEEEEDSLQQEAEEKSRTVKDFELLQMGLEIQNLKRGVTEQQKVVGRENGKLILELEEQNKGGDMAADRSKKRKFELDEDELIRLANEERQKARVALTVEKSAADAKRLPSFWVPSLTPSVAPAEMKNMPLKLKPVCPASNKNHIHNYNHRTLVKVIFTEEKDEKTKYGEAQRICPACKKGLSNSCKAMLAKPCGHVVCKPCADKFMTSSNDPHEKDKSTRCYVCEADLTDKKKSSKRKSKDKDRIRPGLVQIQSDGTGFSAGGGNVTTEKQGIAFQC